MRGPVRPEAAGEPAADGGLEAADRVLDGVPVRGHGLGDPRRGLALLERGLGVGVDAVREVEDLGAGALDGVGGPGLEIGERLGGAGGEGGVGHAEIVSGATRRRAAGPQAAAQLRSADRVSSATMKIAARNTTTAGWNASIRRSTTTATTNRPIQPPRRAARNQSPW